jgi:hypothetical protein
VDVGTNFAAWNGKKYSVKMITRQRRVKTRLEPILNDVRPPKLLPDVWSYLAVSALLETASQSCFLTSANYSTWL